jgi:hypothetical protein
LNGEPWSPEEVEKGIERRKLEIEFVEASATYWKPLIPAKNDV